MNRSTLMRRIEAATGMRPLRNGTDADRTDLNHLLAALSVEKSKTIPEIRDMYGLNEGERR